MAKEAEQVNTYKFMAAARCPKTEMLDFYECTLVTPALVPCENIMRVVFSLSTVTLFQEELAERIAFDIGIDGELTLTGTHSGVTVVARVT